MPLFSHVIVSRFLAEQSPIYQADWPPGDCFVAKNAPRNDKHNSFDARLNSYQSFIHAVILCVRSVQFHIEEVTR
jgi:hypothetical protein